MYCGFESDLHSQHKLFFNINALFRICGPISGDLETGCNMADSNHTRVTADIPISLESPFRR